MWKLIKKISKQIYFVFNYYLIHMGDPVSYLRSQGAMIGEHCDIYCGIGGFGTEPYLIHIGNNVTLTGGVKLITHDGGTRVYRSTDPRWKPETGLYGKINIGDNVFIGTDSIVLPGIEIGTNVIVGAGSVVTKDIPSNVVFAGNPARFIQTLDEYREKSLGKTVLIRESSDPQKKKSELIRLFWSQKVNNGQ